MSGLIARVKQMFGKASPEQIDRAADAVETHVTDERIDQAMDRVPGGDRVRDRIPDNAGQKAADAMREHAGGGEQPREQ